MGHDRLAWTVEESAIAYSCEGFDIVNQNVRLPEGGRAEFDYLSEPPSVVILPFTTDGEVVMIEEWRQAVERLNRGLPAGTAEPGDDDLAATARRELTEETGYVADTLEPLVSVEPANGLANTVHHYFVATGCSPTGEQHLDEDETILVDTMPYEELLTRVRRGDLRDGRTVLGVLYYQMARSE